MTHDRKLKLRLFGSFSAEWTDGTVLRIPGGKQRALVAMLATAAQGIHTRSWLQEMLWKLSGQEHGRASLRRALSDLRTMLGASFNDLFQITNIDIRLDPERVEVIGDRRDGEFLEGLDIPERGFQAWLKEKRHHFEPGASRLPAMHHVRVVPAVAVIPFAPRSGNPAEKHAGDLMALEITRSLSRSHLIDVISHLSSRKFEQPVIDLESVRRSLGIDYLVYGTVFVDGDTFRVDADFVEASTGRIQWTRDFSGRLSVFLQRDRGLVEELSSFIGRSILSASVELARTHPLPAVESHALFMSAISLMHQHVLASFSRARVQLEELIRRCPDHAVLHSWLGKWYILSIAQGWSTDAQRDTQMATDCTGRALDINPHCSFSLAIDGMIQNNARKTFSVAASRFDDAVAIDPNNAIAWLLRSRLNSFVGRGEDAVACANRALALSPLDPYAYFFDSLAATAYVANGDCEQGLKLIDRSITANPRHTSSYRVRAVALDKLGRQDEAKQAVETLRRLEPSLTIKSYLNNHPAADYPIGREWANSLQRSGLPEH